MSQHRDLDVTKRDRFELLSAYLDGEVSPDERQLVATWLDQDPEAQCLYQRLLQLRQGLQSLTPEQWQVSHCGDTAEQVFRKLNRRFRRACMAGMTAATVAVIGVFSGALHPFERIGGTLSASRSENNLEIALDQPPIAIPKPVMTKGSSGIESVLPASQTTSEVSETAL